MILAASIYARVRVATGVEYSTERWVTACQAVDKLASRGAAGAGAGRIHMVRGDGMKVDLSGYTVVYAAAVCFRRRMLARLVFQVRQMRAGSRVIIVGHLGLPGELLAAPMPGLTNILEHKGVRKQPMNYKAWEHFHVYHVAPAPDPSLVSGTQKVLSMAPEQRVWKDRVLTDPASIVLRPHGRHFHGPRRCTYTQNTPLAARRPRSRARED